MKVLIIGKGGREHALAWKIAQSDKVEQVFVAPGNVGMKSVAEIVSINETDNEKLAEFAKKEQIDLTIVGPEASLASGVVDVFLQHNLKIWGPTKAAAMIESSKDFAKTIMNQANVPNAKHQTFTEINAAIDYIKSIGIPLVIKADGLAAGKGVVIPETLEDAIETAKDMLSGNSFGDAGAKIVIEEFLEGNEYSLMAFVHNDTVIPMIMAQDHKRAYDQDKGPNTGGMGAYAPCFRENSAEVQKATEEIMLPVAKELIKNGTPFTGFLYGGLILTKDGFKVIEFNARFGDPETEVILPLLESDLAEIILNILDQKTPEISWKNSYCVGVVLAANGYPDKPLKDIPINAELPKDANQLIFYSGVHEKDGELLSNGGRILVAVGLSNTFSDAQKEAYKVIDSVKNSETFYRSDIGYRFLS